MIKQKRDAGICRNKKEKQIQGKLTMQLEEINQKVLPKDGRLKRYRKRVKQYREKRTFQNDERKFYKQLGGADTKPYQNRRQKKPNNLGLKYGNKKKQQTQWKSRIDKQQDEIIRKAGSVPESGYTLRFTKNDTKNIKVENAMMQNMVYGSRN